MDKLRELSLFTGIGGGLIAGKQLGWSCVCAVEIDKYCQQILLKRQSEGLLPEFPIWDDVRTFDAKPWRGYVDIVSGGFPCQDISVAGTGKGINGSRSGLWSEMARIISECQPKYCFIENSPRLIYLGLEVVLEDLYKMGYDARWGVVSAAHAGAHHKRERLWIKATSNADDLR